MAFRGEASAVRVSDAQVVSADRTSTVIDHTAIAPADALRVRLAVGFLIVVAMIDCILYLPKLF